jgi:4-methyl-5(b-hydroxyethyl)-thiazole monophosphate biosynthesis
MNIFKAYIKERLKKMVYIFLGEGFEEIEAITIVDILRRAEIDVKTVSVKGETVYGAHGICVKADMLIKDVDKENAQMFILPGGMPGTLNLEKNEDMQYILKYAVDNKKWIAAICAAPSILGHKGYLNGKEAICFPGFEKELTGAVIKDCNVCVSGKIITSKGPGTASDLAYYIVSRLKGEDLAHRLKVQMIFG